MCVYVCMHVLSLCMYAYLCVQISLWELESCHVITWLVHAAHIRTYISMYICVCYVLYMCVCVYIYICIYIHIIYVCIYIQCMHVCVWYTCACCILMYTCACVRVYDVPDVCTFDWSRSLHSPHDAYYSVWLLFFQKALFQSTVSVYACACLNMYFPCVCVCYVCACVHYEKVTHMFVCSYAYFLAKCLERITTIDIQSYIHARPVGSLEFKWCMCHARARARLCSWWPTHGKGVQNSDGIVFKQPMYGVMLCTRVNCLCARLFCVKALCARFVIHVSWREISFIMGGIHYRQSVTCDALHP